MKAFQQIMPDLDDAVVAAEIDSRTGADCPCGAAGTRCTTTCFNCRHYRATCEACFVERHKQSPYHWPECWNSSFFVRKDISGLGYVQTFGHDGDPCPMADYSGDIRKTSIVDMIIVDTTGIHSTRVVFCKCPSHRDRLHQLLDARIFPATIKQPETGFTFEVLRDFHLATLCSKKSAYDYLGALRRKSNNACPREVPVSTSAARYAYFQLIRILVPDQSVFAG